MYFFLHDFINRETEVLEKGNLYIQYAILAEVRIIFFPFCQLARMCRFMMKLTLKFALKHKILRWQCRLMYGPALLASFTIGVLMWYTRTLTYIYKIRTSFLWLVHKLIFINCNLQILREPKMASKIFLPFLLLLCLSAGNGALVDDRKVFFIIPLFLQVLYLTKRFRFWQRVRIFSLLKFSWVFKNVTSCVF